MLAATAAGSLWFVFFFTFETRWCWNSPPPQKKNTTLATQPSHLPEAFVLFSFMCKCMADYCSPIHLTLPTGRKFNSLTDMLNRNTTMSRTKIRCPYSSRLLFSNNPTHQEKVTRIQNHWQHEILTSQRTFSRMLINFQLLKN